MCVSMLLACIAFGRVRFGSAGFAQLQLRLRATCRLVTALGLLISATHAFAQANATWNAALAEGSAQAAHGNLTLAIEYFQAAQRAAVTPVEKAKAAGELGAVLAQSRRFDEAVTQLREAYENASGAARARYATDLGNLAMLRKRLGLDA